MINNKPKSYWHRRLIHLTIGLFPILYYWVAAPLCQHYGLSPTYLLLAFALCMMIIEAERLISGRLYYSQREYERKYFSAWFWTGMGLITVFLFAPEYNGYKEAFAFPIVFCLTIGDPLLGELRRLDFAKWKVVLFTLIPLTAIWFLTTIWFGTPYWLVLIMPALAIAAEWPRLRWIDDNFMMLIIPLLLVLITI